MAPVAPPPGFCILGFLRASVLIPRVTPRGNIRAEGFPLEWGGSVRWSSRCAFAVVRSHAGGVVRLDDHPELARFPSPRLRGPAGSPASIAFTGGMRHSVTAIAPLLRPGVPLLGVLARNWWMLLVNGVGALVFGGVAFAWPQVTLQALVILFGCYCLVDGFSAL